MWICNRCQHHNREGDSQCIQCAAPRHARRFGAGTQVETPSVSEQAETDVPPVEPAAAPILQQPQGRMPRMDLAPPRRVVRCAAGRWLTGLGIALLVLLPGLTTLTAVNNRQAWMPLARALLFPESPGDAVALEALSYLLLGLGAVLVSALPGLGALGLGRLLIRLTPPELTRK